VDVFCRAKVSTNGVKTRANKGEESMHAFSSFNNLLRREECVMGRIRDPAHGLRTGVLQYKLPKKAVTDSSHHILRVTYSSLDSTRCAGVARLSPAILQYHNFNFFFDGQCHLHTNENYSRDHRLELTYKEYFNRKR
jgi:hypothetical protein